MISFSLFVECVIEVSDKTQLLTIDSGPESYIQNQILGKTEQLSKATFHTH